MLGDSSVTVKPEELRQDAVLNNFNNREPVNSSGRPRSKSPRLRDRSQDQNGREALPMIDIRDSRSPLSPALAAQLRNRRASSSRGPRRPGSSASRAGVLRPGSSRPSQNSQRSGRPSRPSSGARLAPLRPRNNYLL